MRALISSCFLIATRYDKKQQTKPEISELVEFLKTNKIEIVPVCPEQLGGLPTPRRPAEISGDKIINAEGTDVTENFIFGASQVVQLATNLEIDFAILKENSPSCGVNHIYDGSHKRQLIAGMGITTRELEKNQIRVFSEEDIDAIKEYICEQRI